MRSNSKSSNEHHSSNWIDVRSDMEMKKKKKDLKTNPDRNAKHIVSNRIPPNIATALQLPITNKHTSNPQNHTNKKIYIYI